MVEAERLRAVSALAAKLRGDDVVEHRVVVGVEWCRFARHWTVVTELRHKWLAEEEEEEEEEEDTVEKYPIDESLVEMIVQSPHNAGLVREPAPAGPKKSRSGKRKPGPPRVKAAPMKGRLPGAAIKRFVESNAPLRVRDQR